MTGYEIIVRASSKSPDNPNVKEIIVVKPGERNMYGLPDFESFEVSLNSQQIINFLKNKQVKVSA